MGSGTIISDYVAFAFASPPPPYGIFAHLATFPGAAPGGVFYGDLTDPIYNQIPSTRIDNGCVSNFWRISSVTGGTFIITMRASGDPIYPLDAVTAFDTYLYLWDDAKTTIIDQNDDGGGLGTSYMNDVLAPGTSYLVECTTYSNYSALMPYELCFYLPADIIAIELTSLGT